MTETKMLYMLPMDDNDLRVLWRILYDSTGTGLEVVPGVSSFDAEVSRDVMIDTVEDAMRERGIEIPEL
jgi:hypothetical protein